MKSAIVIVTTITLAAVIVFSGCNSSTDKREKADVSVYEANQP